MSNVNELLATGPSETPFDIMRCAYGELVVTDLDASVHFYGDLLGMVLTERTEDAAYFRGWEERGHHSIVLRQGPVAGVGRLSFRVRRDTDLELLQQEFDRRGLATSWTDGDLAGMSRALRVTDPFGYPLEFFHAMEQEEVLLQRFDIQRGAPIMRFDHFNLHVPNVEDAFRFWQELGFLCSEYISTDDPGSETVTGAWLRRKPGVHDVALTAGRGPRLHHLGLYVGETGGIMRACDQLAAAGYAKAIERGPGRHGVSNAFFVYLRDPDGHRIELYACDYYTGDPDHKPLRWSVNDERCRSFWGTKAPDSWYDESSLLLDAQGATVETRASGVDERAQHSEVLA
jgi:3,4-dihydroxyphenylacetate 2,3-dioxygenase